MNEGECCEATGSVQGERLGWWAETQSRQLIPTGGGGARGQGFLGRWAAVMVTLMMTGSG